MNKDDVGTNNLNNNNSNDNNNNLAIENFNTFQAKLRLSFNGN